MSESKKKNPAPKFGDAMDAAKAAKKAKKAKIKTEQADVAKKQAPHAINPNIGSTAKAHVPQMVRRSKKGG